MNNSFVPTNSKQDLRRGVDHIGVSCVFFCHDGQGNLLMHKRSTKCRDEHGRWDCGGGALEFGETLEEAIQREVKEEYGVEPLEILQLYTCNVLRKNGEIDTHWVGVVHSVKVERAKVIIGEPEKMDEIGWFTKDTLPEPLHSQIHRHIPLMIKAGII